MSYSNMSTINAPAALSTHALVSFLDKVTSRDKDIRYMAASDLLAELDGSASGKEKDKTMSSRVRSGSAAGGGAPPDAALEKKLGTAVLALMKDSATEVAALSVKLLPVLVNYMSAPCGVEMLESLVGIGMGETDSDLARMGLKAVAADLKSTAASVSVLRVTLPKLIATLPRDAGEVNRSERAADALEAITTIFTRFGRDLPEVQREASEKLLPMLDSEHRHSQVAMVKKRVVQCLASIVAATTSRELVRSICRRVAEGARQSEEYYRRRSSEGNDPLLEHDPAETVNAKDILRVYTSALGVLSNAGASGAAAVQLAPLVPVVTESCRACKGEGDDELRETCLQTLESFVGHARESTFVRGMLPDLLSLGLEYLSFDPNYNYDDDEDMGDGDDDEFSDDDEEEDEDYSDDEDQSWKVRRASAQLLIAIFKSRCVRLDALYGAAADTLITRFVEREESVKLEVFSALTVLLQETLASPAPTSSSAVGGDGSTPSAIAARSSAPSADMPMLPTAAAAAASTFVVELNSVPYDVTQARMLFARVLPSIITAATKQLKNVKSVKTKVACFGILREIVGVLPTDVANDGGLRSIADKHVGDIVPHAERALRDATWSTPSSLRIEALILLRMMMSAGIGNASVFTSSGLVEPVVAAMSDRYYKVAAEALRVVACMIGALRPSGRGDEPVPGVDESSVVATLYPGMLERLMKSDQDQEVKEAAISAMATMIALMGSVVAAGDGGRLLTVLPLLHDRLENETTRLSAVKAFTLIASEGSLSADDMGDVLPRTIATLTGLLRKADRGLRMASLTCLLALVDRYGVGGDDDAVAAAKVSSELAHLVNSGDLQMTGGALLLSAVLVTRQPEMGARVSELLLKNALSVLSSPLLQGQSLTAVHFFFACLLLSSDAAPAAQTSFESLRHMLLGLGSGVYLNSSSDKLMPRQACDNIASTVAVLCAAAGGDAAQRTMCLLMDGLGSSSSGGSSATAGVNAYRERLLCIGEIGRRAGTEAEGVEAHISRALASSSEEVRNAASFALGNLALGDADRFLPCILGGFAPSSSSSVATTDNDATAMPVDATTTITAKTEYMLLHALKVVISSQTPVPSLPAPQTLSRVAEIAHVSVSPLGAAGMQRILDALFAKSGSDEVGVRNVVAECLGKLSASEPATVLPKVDILSGDTSAFVRSTYFSALRCAVMDSASSSGSGSGSGSGSSVVGSPFATSMRHVVAGLRDTDVDVRRNAVLLVTAATTHSLALVSSALLDTSTTAMSDDAMHGNGNGNGGTADDVVVHGSLASLLLAQLAVDESLVRVVDLGPFKHTVDDGHDLRKSAYECCAAIVAALHGSGIPAQSFAGALASGLGDSYDIKLLCTSIAITMCTTQVSAMTERVEAMTVPIEKTLNIRLKSDAVKQEADRHEDMLRATLRLVDAITKLIDYGDEEDQEEGGTATGSAAGGGSAARVSSRFPSFCGLMAKIEKAPAFLAKLTAVRDEAAAALQSATTNTDTHTTPS